MVHRDPSDREKPTIATWLICRRDSKFFKDAIAALGSGPPSTHIINKEERVDDSDLSAVPSSDHTVKKEEPGNHGDIPAGVSTSAIEPHLLNQEEHGTHHGDALAGAEVTVKVERIDGSDLDNVPSIRSPSTTRATKRKSRSPELDRDDPRQGWPVTRISASQEAAVDTEPTIKLEMDTTPISKVEDTRIDIKVEDIKSEGDRRNL